MPVVPVTLASGLRLARILFLDNRVRLGVVALASQADQRIFRDIVDMYWLKAISIDFAENLAQILHGDAVLRTARSGQTGLNAAKIEFEQVIKARLGRFVGAEETLGLCVVFDQLDQFGIAACTAQIEQGFGIDGEKRCRRTKFG